MLSRVLTSAVRGMKAVAVSVEVDINRGFSGIHVVGLGDETVKEAAARIKSAVRNSGYEFPVSNITVNLSPAWLRKKGSQFDLPMAIGILVSSGQVFDQGISEICFIGELSLDGALNRCNGILPMLSELRKCGVSRVIIPAANETEAALFDDIDVYCAHSLAEVCDYLNLKNNLKKVQGIDRRTLESKPCEGVYDKDFSDVKGQEFAKRAITVAVSGGHGMFIVGSPGTGKTMLAERIPYIMPAPDFNEIIEITSVYSISGMLDEKIGYISRRPFRATGAAVTKAGLIGGGSSVKPGEITLAHKGVLFMDEFYEIDRNILDALRIPLERKSVSFIRNGETYIFPCDFLLVAAANPCRCGYYGDPEHECSCTGREIERYRSRVSGPVLDRIDINIELLSVRYDELDSGESLSSAEMSDVIENARGRQAHRYRNERFSLNSQLPEGASAKYIKLGKSERDFLKDAYDRLSLNPRGLSKIRKLARTIADVEDKEKIEISHIAEALRYRERKLL